MIWDASNVPNKSDYSAAASKIAVLYAKTSIFVKNGKCLHNFGDYKDTQKKIKSTYKISMHRQALSLSSFLLD